MGNIDGSRDAVISHRLWTYSYPYIRRETNFTDIGTDSDVVIGFKLQNDRTRNSN